MTKVWDVWWCWCILLCILYVLFDDLRHAGMGTFDVWLYFCFNTYRCYEWLSPLELCVYIYWYIVVLLFLRFLSGSYKDSLFWKKWYYWYFNEHDLRLFSIKCHETYNNSLIFLLSGWSTKLCGDKWEADCRWKNWEDEAKTHSKFCHWLWCSYVVSISRGEDCHNQSKFNHTKRGLVQCALCMHGLQTLLLVVPELCDCSREGGCW